MSECWPLGYLLNISSQNYAQTSLKSITMQMVSDFMHFDTTALRQKNALEKWTVIIFVQCVHP